MRSILRRYASESVCYARLKLRHRIDEPLDVFLPRQAMIAVLHQGQDDVVMGEPRHQLDGMPPRHIGVLDPLQDAYRAAGFDQSAEQEMAAPILDEAARDHMGLVGILRRPRPKARGFDLAPDPFGKP